PGHSQSGRFASAVRGNLPRGGWSPAGVRGDSRRLEILVLTRSLDVLVLPRGLDVFVLPRSLDILVLTRGLNILIPARGLDILILTGCLDILVLPWRLHVLVLASQAQGGRQRYRDDRAERYCSKLSHASVLSRHRVNVSGSTSRVNVSLCLRRTL